MAWTVWALLLVYAGSVLLLVLGRIAAWRSPPVRRFLIGEQADDGWERRAEVDWRRGG